MNVEFEDSELEKLAYDASYVGKWSPAIVKRFRRTIMLLETIEDRTSLYNWTGLKPEKMKGKYQGYSTIRLNKQWRVFFKIKKSGKKESIVIFHIGDPH